MAAASMVIASAIKAAACRMRSGLVAMCSHEGLRWPAEYAQHLDELGVGPEHAGFYEVELMPLAVVKAHEVLPS